MGKEKKVKGKPVPCFTLSLSRGNLSANINIDYDLMKDTDAFALSAIILRDGWINGLIKGKPKKKK